MPDDKSLVGHRKRLWDRFIKSGINSFHDYEIIELLLTLGSLRCDCKKQAKEALNKFKNLRRVLKAPVEELQQIKDIGLHNAFGIKLVQEVARKFLKEKIIDKPVYSSSQEIFDYLYHSMRKLKKELFKVLYLNSQNQVIDTNNLFEGTTTDSSISTSGVIESTPKNNVASLVFAHNHPSVNPEPSWNDKQITRDLVYAVAVMQIKIPDHIIIGDNRYFSFAADGLIEECELDFLDLKVKGVSEERRKIYKAEFFGELG